MLDSFLLISNDKDFFINSQKAFENHAYDLVFAEAPDPSTLSGYSLIIIYSEQAPLFLFEIRKVQNIPIIVIDSDRSLAYQYLEQGADDYMAMPINFKELVARCRAVLRRNNLGVKKANNEIRYDGLIISKESYDIRVQNSYVALSSREFEIMFLLASNPNKVLSRDEILNAAFGVDYDGDLRTVDVHIKKIRDKVETPENIWSIKTVRGVGYKFCI